MTQFRQYVFTFNNWRESDLPKLVAGTKFGKGNEILYMLYSKEVAPTGTPHLQGVAHVKLKVTKESLNKKLFRNAALLEAQRGTKEENLAYITKVKTNEFHESGSPLAQGTRTDLDSLGQAIVAGERPEDIALQTLALTSGTLRAPTLSAQLLSTAFEIAKLQGTLLFTMALLGVEKPDWPSTPLSATSDQMDTSSSPPEWLTGGADTTDTSVPSSTSSAPLTSPRSHSDFWTAANIESQESLREDLDSLWLTLST